MAPSPPANPGPGELGKSISPTSSDNFIASQLTDSNGGLRLRGPIAPGTYTGRRIRATPGWTQSAACPPPPGTFTVTVAAERRRLRSPVRRLPGHHHPAVSVVVDTGNARQHHSIRATQACPAWTVDLFDFIPATCSPTSGRFSPTAIISFSDLVPLPAALYLHGRRRRNLAGLGTADRIPARSEHLYVVGDQRCRSGRASRLATSSPRDLHRHRPQQA